MQDTIKEIFTESIQVQIAAGEVLPSALEAAAFTIAQSLINGNKLICCGTASCHMLASAYGRYIDQLLRNRTSLFTGNRAVTRTYQSWSKHPK